MCGILGGNNKQWNYEKALDSIGHRGPDGSRIVIGDAFSLGFVRLAIRDLTDRAMQPMQSKDEQVMIVFNGEIYGYHDLKKQLINSGKEFHTTSDTEVLLNAYLQYGDTFIDYVDGMFAIAIVDYRVNKVKIYRDRLGIKPLFYFYDGKNFAFASELKAIQNLCDNIQFRKENTAFFDYFTYRYVPEPKTILKNVYKLEPAMELIYSIDNRTITQNKYWKLHVNTSRGKGKYNYKDVQYELRELISESVREQLEADVTVGAFLSGGIDSSIVTAEIFRNNQLRETFSLGFYTRYNDKEFDETQYAKLLADKYLFPHYIGYYEKDELQRRKKEIKEWFDEPFADTSCYPTYQISKVAREHNNIVILTGDGGDEVFGGYTRYTKCKDVWDTSILHKMKSLYNSMDMYHQEKESLFEELFDELTVFSKYAYAIPKRKNKEYKKLFNISADYDEYWYFRRYNHKELPPITRAQYIDLKTYLPADILTKVDRTAMQNSIETRVPFLSRKIVEFSFGLPEEVRCPNGELKGLLKDTYKDIIPHEILYKSKKGFSMPRSYLQSNVEERYTLWNKYWKSEWKSMKMK